MQEMNENSRMIIHSSENKGNKKIKIIKKKDVTFFFIVNKFLPKFI